MTARAPSKDKTAIAATIMHRIEALIAIFGWRVKFLIAASARKPRS